MINEQDTSPAPEASEDDERAALWREMQDDDAAKTKDAPAAEARADDESGDAPNADDTPLPPADPQPTPPAQTAGETGQDKADDPWATVPEPIRKQHQELQTNFERLRGQISRQDRELNELRRRASAPSKQGDAPARVEDLKKLRSELNEEWPELAAKFTPIIDHLEGKVDTATKTLQALQSQQAKEAEDRALAALTANHADYTDLINPNGPHAPKLVAWIESEEVPAWVKRVAQQNWDRVTDPEGMSRLLAAFKAHAGIGAQPAPNPPNGAAQPARGQTQPLSDRRKRQLEGATAVPSSPRRPTVSGIPESGSREDIWKALAAQGL